MNCKICGASFDKYSSLSSHIRKHKISAQQYYMKYVNKMSGKCFVCGHPTKFHSIEKGFVYTCSKECFNSPAGKLFQQQQREISNLKKYGVRNVQQLQSTQQKRKITMLQKYGVEHALQNNNINSKMKKTLSSRTPRQKQLQKERNKKTISNIPNFWAKRQEKSNQTMLQKYGASSIMQIPEIQKNITNKAALTKLKKNFSTFVEKLSQTKNIVPLFSVNDINITNPNYKFLCKDCKRIWSTKITGCGNLNYIHCNCKRQRSYAENEIVQFLYLIGIKRIELNKRFTHLNKRFEIDIYLPDYKIGIEHDGLYWHNFEILGKKYHIDKTNFFKNNFNIRIIHVFEHEWKNKNDIVKSIIRQLLNLTELKFYARKLSFQPVSTIQYKHFLENNHIQGYAAAKIKYGLFDKDELISLMSVSMNRFKPGTFELVRFCNKLNSHTIGGFSKLLKNILKIHHINVIHSYCDLRYFNGNGYLKVGFQQMNITQPNYFYFHKTKEPLNVYSRLQFQKYKLRQKLPLFNENETEYQNMSNNNYLKIYDCGNIHLKYSM